MDIPEAHTGVLLKGWVLGKLTGCEQVLRGWL